MLAEAVNRSVKSPLNEAVKLPVTPPGATTSRPEATVTVRSPPPRTSSASVIAMLVVVAVRVISRVATVIVWPSTVRSMPLISTRSRTVADGRVSTSTVTPRSVMPAAGRLTLAVRLATTPLAPTVRSEPISVIWTPPRSMLPLVTANVRSPVASWLTVIFSACSVMPPKPRLALLIVKAVTLVSVNSTGTVATGSPTAGMVRLAETVWPVLLKRTEVVPAMVTPGTPRMVTVPLATTA